MGVVWTLIVTRLSMEVIEYFFWWMSLLNPGTLIGLGLAGVIGVLGFALGHWDRTTGIAVCLLGGCIGSGMYRFEFGPRYQQNREIEKLMLDHVLRNRKRKAIE